jgi:glycosyltransferase 2 family protein
MNKKRVVIYGVVLAVLALLVYLQFRTWRNFDWAAFLSQTDQVREHKLDILSGIALIYLAYAMRAIRWKIFLRPVKHTSATGLVVPTIIGFTGLALLGRPGEFIRPYLIGRRENLSFSSQLAVWTVERIFDIGSFALLLISAIFFAQAPRQLLYYDRFRVAGFAIIVLVAGLSAGAGIVSWQGEAVADWIAKRFSHLASNLAHRIALRIREFRSGLNTIHSFSSLLQLAAVSVAMWVMIALAYWEVMQSYGAGSLNRPISQVPLLMASSMVGSLIQLPGVGGGSQLATISTLQHVFQVPRELAASCGILLWLVTFMSVIPMGLFLAHRQRLSLRELSQESQQSETSAELP